MAISSVLQVYLDITSPILNIYMPNVTTNVSIEEFTIESNEFLSSRQDIYIIDSLGNRHDLNFALQEDKKTLIGKIQFNNFPNGMSKIYVQLYDEVWNKSDLYTRSINILDPQNINLKTQEKIAKLEMKLVSRNVYTSEKENLITLKEKRSNIYLKEKERILFLKEGED